MEKSSEEGETSLKCGETLTISDESEMPSNEQETPFVVGDPQVVASSASCCSNVAAPIYSFDKDGDILLRERPLTPNNSIEGSFVCFPKVGEIKGEDRIQNGSSAEEGLEPVTPTSKTTNTRRRKFGMLKRSSNASSEGGNSTSQSASVESSSSALSPATITITTVSAPTTPQGKATPEKPSVPKIDFQAPSIEVVDDYLESHTENDSQLKDFCAAFFGDSGASFTSHQGSCVSLLSAVPQETAPKRQRVPFDAVVFTERKPSTGDALVQSLGLSADETDTIQDIASKNQGAARGRLQLAEGGQCDGGGLKSHCESCGVSPEDCLKKLGLHSDRERVLSPSPKSEKLWQLFQQIQTGFARPSRNRRPSGSEPELNLELSLPHHQCQHHLHHHHHHHHHHHAKTTPTKSRSLESSPLNSPLADIRKHMLHTV